MKNLAILGLASLLLFAVAAGLSMWLNKPPQQTAADDGKDKDKDKDGKKAEKEKTAKGDDKVKPDPAKPDDPSKLAGDVKLQQQDVKRREARIERRQAQEAMVLQDIYAQREELDRIQKQLSDEMKLLSARADELDAREKVTRDDKKKSPTDFANPTPTKPLTELADPNEQKNVQRLAVMFESMAPDTAAKIIQEMADKGKMDTAVKVLRQMRERQAGKLIAEIPDPSLAAQLAEKLRLLKPAPVSGSPTAGGS
jgi:flagellar motility protein MotE (MotC chaperone)